MSDLEDDILITELRIGPKETIEKSLNKLGECKRQGQHIGPVKDVISYTVSSRSNPFRDNVSVQCSYCGMIFKRPLNLGELKEISDFNRSIHGTDLIY